MNESVHTSLNFQVLLCNCQNRSHYILVSERRPAANCCWSYKEGQFHFSNVKCKGAESCCEIPEDLTFFFQTPECWLFILWISMGAWRSNFPSRWSLEKKYFTLKNQSVLVETVEMWHRVQTASCHVVGKFGPVSPALRIYREYRIRRAWVLGLQTIAPVCLILGISGIPPDIHSTVTYFHMFQKQNGITRLIDPTENNPLTHIELCTWTIEQNL